MKKNPVALALLAFGVLSAACAGGSKLTELQTVRSGDLDVVLLSPNDALRHGKDTFTIEFRAGPGGQLVDVGNVRVNASMPMPGMPMFGSINVQRTDVPGRYTADAVLSMAGTWRLTIEWEGHQVSFAGSVQ